jgi:magnesium chelatase family protein
MSYVLPSSNSWEQGYCHKNKDIRAGSKRTPKKTYEYARAMEIAAAGGHNLFLRGLPGSGKTMLARVTPTILPPLTESEAIEVTKIYSITGNLPGGSSIMTERPFRAPHHTTSQIGLIGGGKHPLPGEISLSHRGVLFLDEFPEFPRFVLEALRQPLEDGIVTISRASGTMIYPARFLLIAAANPCPCGNFGSDQKKCICSSQIISRYQHKISGPILDRIDLHVTVPSVATEKLTNSLIAKGESSHSVRTRVIAARERQYQRFKSQKIHTNTEMNTKMVKEFCPLTPESQSFLKEAISTFGLSARSYYRVIKVARTIADLASVSQIQLSHIAEAVMYRPKEE